MYKLTDPLMHSIHFTGLHQISKVHLEELIRDVSKDQHGLTQGDLSNKDKMKFDPVIKMTQERVTLNLEKHVPLSLGTTEFLKAVACIISAFMDLNLKPSERVFKAW